MTLAPRSRAPSLPHLQKMRHHKQKMNLEEHRNLSHSIQSTQSSLMQLDTYLQNYTLHDIQ